MICLGFGSFRASNPPCPNLDIQTCDNNKHAIYIFDGVRKKAFCDSDIKIRLSFKLNIIINLPS